MKPETLNLGPHMISSSVQTLFTAGKLKEDIMIMQMPENLNIDQKNMMTILN